MAATTLRGGSTGVAVYPGRPHSLHLTTLPLAQPGAGEVAVRVRRIGVCGTDREIIDAKFGTPPAGSDELVLGHEVLGVVETVGDGVDAVKPGDLVSATVRRGDGCPSCQAGQFDMCEWLGYQERGIIGQHGFMTERFLERVENLVPVTPELEPVAVLLEPLSIVEKAYRQAEEIQRRMAVWSPKTAIVLGAGPIGLLGTLLLRAKGIDIYTLARTPGPTPASRIVESSGGHYVSTKETSLRELEKTLPNIDLIIEATGYGPLAFEAMDILGNSGVLVWLSIVGGDDQQPLPVNSILRGHVLGNKVTVGSVNSAHQDFTAGVSDLGAFERLWPGLTASLITHRLRLDEATSIGEAIQGSVKTVIEFS